jgi:GNAT superfamily N-acetyltransferase
MPALTDPGAIRALLETDRRWAVYALGDLAPGFFEHCRWLRPPGGEPALALLYGSFTPVVLFTLGTPEALAPLLDEINTEPALSLSVRPEIVPLLETRYRVFPKKAMWRMILDPARYQPQPAADAVRLGPADLPEVERLFADGDAADEAPDAFAPAMLEQGTFFGLREGRELIATAGTHLVNPAESVGAIGNIYTRRDRRSRGLATLLTSAVASELLRRGIRTVALNVNQGNAAALRVYERLGFVRYCAFCEGLAKLDE